jgi:protein-S-isoprenylcysteine O-methyltransferase Ste14
MFTRLFSNLFFLSIPWIVSGRLDWAPGWILPALSTALMIATFLILRAVNPELLRERQKHLRPTVAFDKIIFLLLTLGTLAAMVTAGLDARWGWSHLPLWVNLLGALLIVAGMVPTTWSMAVNRFLETTVRIQEERGHTVVTDGPYRLVRHPMYFGMVLTNIGYPLLLGSLPALIPGLFCALCFVVRTAFEDRHLMARLPGYPEFAARTRYRLVPGLW